MTIKQQGGIFGRNPTFNDLEVEGNLTVGGDTISATSGSFSTIDSDAATYGLTDQVAFSLKGRTSTFGTNAIAELSIQSGATTYYNGALVVKVTPNYNSNPAEEVARFTSGGLAFVDGKGINFSATSDATGSTSELFDDYEEGTWTPAFSGGDYSFTYNKQKGSYTKIGNRVYVDCVLYIHPTTAPSGSVDGNVSITGLPYAFNKQNDVEFVGGIIHFKQLFMTSVEAIGYRLSDGETSLLMYDTLATTYPELAYVQASDVNANSRIRLQFSYPTNG